MADLGKWVPLRDFKCPVKGCPSKDRGEWTCKEDGTLVFINARGKMECKPGTHSGDICTWGWNCGNSFHQGKFDRVDFNGFNFAMSQALQLMDKMGSEWCAALMLELGKQYGR